MTMSTPTACPSSIELQEVLRITVEEQGIKGRKKPRIPASMIAEISTAPEKMIPATVREISATGMGFMHREPLGLQEVSVNVLIDGDELRVRVVVEWCRQCDNGMYMSGGHFLRAAKCRGEFAI